MQHLLVSLCDRRNNTCSSKPCNRNERLFSWRVCVQQEHIKYPLGQHIQQTDTDNVIIWLYKMRFYAFFYTICEFAPN